MSGRDLSGYRLFFDVGSPYAWIIAESAAVAVPQIEWVPLCQRDVGDAVLWDGDRERVLAMAEGRSLLAPRFDDSRDDLTSADSREMALAATYTKALGRTIAFGLSAFRHVHAAPRPIDDHFTVLVAGAGCEMATGAIEAGIKMESTIEQMAEASEQLRTAAGGPVQLPVLLAPDGTITDGDALIELALDDFAAFT